MESYRTGALGAILDEYERAIADLQQVLATVSDEELVAVVDPVASDPNCKSIQSIMAHVIRAGHNYATLFATLEGKEVVMHEREYHDQSGQYVRALNEVHAHTAEVLGRFPDSILDQFDPQRRIQSFWGQSFDPEQLLEHAIVHILRHRRQISRFLERIRDGST